MSLNRFLFTTGNTDGVGLEVTIKAHLLENKKHDDIKIIFCDRKELVKHSTLYNFKIDDLNFIDDFTSDLSAGVYFYTYGRPLDWFKNSVDYASKNPNCTAVITGPLSKDHFKDPLITGHTSYLESEFKNYDLFMTFLGSIYNCLLLTDHLPMTKLSEEIIEQRLIKALRLIIKLKESLELIKPIAVLGLNPHAGENGLIGKEELHVHKKIIPQFKDIVGPLPGDGFFSKESYKKYSLIVANYHDQGLIPFKLLHGFSGCQTTLGLPFVRTSVNHGTALDLYLKNKANPSSMKQAYLVAKKILNGGFYKYETQ